MQQKIENLLDKLGIPIDNLGYKYLIMAVQLHKETSKTLEGIYQTIADKYETTKYSVERAIRHVHENRKEQLKEFFNLEYTITTKRFIFLLARELERTNNG